MTASQPIPTLPDPDTASLMKLIRSDELTLLLVRHGQAGGNGSLDGWLEDALSPLGEQQAERLAARLAPLPLDHIYASDMARTHQTAQAVAHFHPQTPFQNRPEIREISSFQVRGWPSALTAEARRIRQAERKRVTRFAAHLKETHGVGQLVAIIGHNGLNGMLMAELAATQYRRCLRLVCAHTSVSVLSLSRQAPTVTLRLMGCTRHLPPELVTDLNVKP